MPTKPVVGITTVGSQKDRRYLDTFYDQHRSTRFPNGRPWWGIREIAANRDFDPHLKDGFCGSELIPGRHVEDGEAREVAWKDGWSAPWLPEFRFFQLDYKRNRIQIRYDLHQAYDAAEELKYFRAANLICVEKSWAASPFGIRPRWEVRAVLGEPPRSPLIARAAQAGDEWILGTDPRPNTHLATLLGLTPSGLSLPDQLAGAAKPDDVISMTKHELSAFIAEQIAEHMARLGADMKKPASRKPMTPAQRAHLADLQAHHAAKRAKLAETTLHEVPEIPEIPESAMSVNAVE